MIKMNFWNEGKKVYREVDGTNDIKMIKECKTEEMAREEVYALTILEIEDFEEIEE